MGIGCINIEVIVKKIQKPLDQGIVSGIINPCNSSDVLKPIIIIYADEYPLGELFELGVIIDKYLEFTTPSYVVLEARLFQAKIIDPKILATLKDVFKAKKFFISKWNIIDLYEPVNVINKYSLEEFLKSKKYLEDPENIYYVGLKNYLSRIRDGIDLLLSTKIRISVLEQ